MKRIAMMGEPTPIEPLLSYADVGKRLNMSAGGVYWIEQRALRMIADALRRDITNTPALRERYGDLIGGQR